MKKTIVMLLLLLSSCGSLQKKMEGAPKLGQTEQFAQRIELAKSKAEEQYIADELFVKATDASLNGDSKIAMELFSILMALRPESPLIQKRYAVELIRLGQFENSVPFLKKIYVKKGETNIGLILAGVYVALEKYKGARKIYRKVLKIEPQSEEACLFLAKTYAAQKKFSKSYWQLNQCEKRTKKAIFSFYKAKIELERGKKASAKKMLRRTIKKDGSLYQPVIALGILYEQEEKFKKAKAVYNQYIIRNRDNYAVLSKLVQVMLALGENMKVIPYIERLVELDQSDLNLKVKLGILYTDAQLYREAKGVFQEILYVMPDSDKVLYYLGSLTQQLNESEESIAYFGRINDESNLYGDGVVQIAQMLSSFALKDHMNGDSQHINRFEDYLSAKREKDENLRVELGVVEAGYFETIEKLEKAIDALSQVKKLEGFGEDHGYYLASLLDKANRPGEAIEVMRNLLEKNPNNADALNYIGYSMVERGINLDEAFSYLSKALELKPDDGYIRDSLGWYYYKKRDYVSALRELKMAWKMVKTDMVITRHLGLIYKELKKYSSAKKFYKKALKQCTNENERQDILKEMKDVDQRRRLPASVK